VAEQQQSALAINEFYVFRYTHDKRRLAPGPKPQDDGFGFGFRFENGDDDGDDDDDYEEKAEGNERGIGKGKAKGRRVGGFRPSPSAIVRVVILYTHRHTADGV